ncbi:MAG: glycosyltransferase [Candidatus Eisenbacteria bacterium]|uniref:Glycosyltransferase n=1 Tax=Eiseniibacteriota bacterium TaxID=2212470 RepID=A0A9D6LBT9_UNCEI|nr:glycosyltransferase [Candidatus Eisenbacteria bacterium]MBI3540512.1 glycosyltransferase [Candidatus Eisenbacteria bacterium]
MRVALVGPVHPWRGGIAQYLGLLGESLVPRAEVRGVTFTRQYPGFLFPGESQRDPAAIPPAFPAEPLLDSIAPWTWRRAAAALEAFAPGLVILKWWLPFFGPAFASAVGPLRRRGSRVMLVCDNLVPHERRPFDMAFTRWMLRNSDGYLVMSESVERDLDRLKPGAPRRRVLHPLYAQFDRGRWTRETARAKLGLDGEVALFFGYVRHYKGLDTLLDAWPMVRARRPATLVVAGEFYEDAAPYRARVDAANSGGAGAVRLLDRYIGDDEVEALFKAADVVVLPYRSATQSGVTHVAYALGVPVITTDVGGLAETVRPGETGLVAPPENPAALAEAIVRFFADGMAPRLRAGVAALHQAHSWDVLADTVIELGDALAPARGWR